MLWQIEIGVKDHFRDPVSVGIKTDINDLGIKSVKSIRFVQLYLIEGNFTIHQIERIAHELITDKIVQWYRINTQRSGNKNQKLQTAKDRFHTLTIFHKPGVMDPVELSAIRAVKALGFKANAVKTGRRYIVFGKLTHQQLELITRKVLTNDVIDNVFRGDKRLDHLPCVSPYNFNLVRVPLLELADKALLTLSQEHQLSLDLRELQTIKSYYQRANRNPTDIELETIAQTWSEHCKHKTLMGLINYRTKLNGSWQEEKINNLMRQTVMRVTTELAKPWCISVFEDNAGIIEFDNQDAVCFKVETHNHPSAIEPYGGAGTGMGGVIRDTLGCGLGAKPILSTDVFCFASPNFPYRKIPPGVLHPKRLMKGVVSGVRDYGNRMGIPTANGAVYFDDRYLGNPLVYCGNIGLIPKTKCFKKPKPGDLVLLVGGRTGRDGIHGVTFASVELTEKSETVSSSAVQIGNAIMEKRIVDTILQARDQGLYSAITDCGGGGLSSAVGEMGKDSGCLVDLDKVPLKYQGLSYTEIWISEAQERMVLAVPPQYKDKILALFQREDVEATFIGEFTDTKRLILRYHDKEVADLEMGFLHQGLPKFHREAEWIPKSYPEPKLSKRSNYGPILKKILGMWNIASKEWIIRQYDHEVQGGCVLKPLQGIANDGPGDACVFRPKLDSFRGIVVANGMSPKYGDIDPYHMAASSIDEAIRNIVAVGGDPRRIALLDNFSWGNTNKPDRLGGLVRAAKACYDIAKVYETPFISGKDSLNNEFRIGKESVAIPASLLISALSVIPDVRKTISMELKGPDNLVYLIGLTKPELGGSHYYVYLGHLGKHVPQVDPILGKQIFYALAEAIKQGLVLACHDLSEGGLGVAAAEMAFAGDIGLTLDLTHVPTKVSNNDIILFSESNSRFLVEVPRKHQSVFERVIQACLSGETSRQGCAIGLVGLTQKSKRFKVKGIKSNLIINETLADLKSAWQTPLARIIHANA